MLRVRDLIDECCRNCEYYEQTTGLCLNPALHEVIVDRFYDRGDEVPDISLSIKVSSNCGCSEFEPSDDAWEVAEEAYREVKAMQATYRSIDESLTKSNGWL